MKIVYTGGGTGGHFYPLMAVSEQVRKLVYKNKLVFPIEYYFSSKDIYPEMLLSKNIKYSWVPSGKNRLYFSFLNFVDIFKLGFGVIIAFFKLLFIYPDVIFSKGGYDSIPTCLAAFILRIPIVMHDSDSVPGRASLLISKFAYRIAVSYEESIKYFKDTKNIAFTGQPILEKYTAPADFERVYNENPRKNILVMGGSSGSSKINDTVLAILPQILGRYNLIHQVGNDNLQDIKSRTGVILKDYNAEAYAAYGSLDFSKIYPSVDIVVTRAGSSLFEIASWQLPSVIVPISEQVSRDQTSNANVFYRKGMAHVINENNLSPNLLLNVISDILNNKEEYKKMVNACKSLSKKNAGEIIANEIIEICYSHR